MARLKKNAIGNIEFPMVDKTDFASIESGITASDFNSAATKKFYGVNHGVSNAYTSGTLSMATLLVRSGLFHQELKPAETNYDYITYWFTHPSCADQLIIMQPDTYDDSDIYSQIIVNFSLLSDVDDNVSILLSNVSDVESQVNLNASLLATITGQASVLLSNLSDVDSNLVSMLSDMFSNLSDVESQVDKNASLLDDITGQASVLLSNLSDVDSQLIVNFSLISDVDSQITLNTATLSVLASSVSDIDSQMVLDTASLSDLHSDMSSQFDGISGMLSDIDSQMTLDTATLSDFQSNLLSRVPKLVATNSQVSDLASDLRSYLIGMSGAISDIDSQMTLDTASLSDLHSDMSSQFDGLSNYLSQVHSDLASAIGGVTASVGASDMSDIASRVWATSEGTRVDSRILVLQSNLSDVESAVDLLATSAYLSDVESNLYSAIGNVSVTLTDSDISDIASAVAVATGGVSDSDMSDISSRVWAAATRTLTQGAASVEAAVSGSTITVYRGTTWVISLTGLGDISTYDTIYFSVKDDIADSDNDAILRVKDDASGLLRWQKAAVVTATNGVITINDAVAGDITITILEAETDDAEVRGGYYYDIKGVDDDGQVDLVSFGDKAFNVSGDITRAIIS